MTGIAWELGILKGLADAGVDLSHADLVVGTSAGSVVGAQITSGRPLDELYATQLAPSDNEIGAKLSRLTLLRMVPPLLLPGSGSGSVPGSARMSMRAHPPGGRERIEVIRSRIGVEKWPDRELKVTAVEAETGRFVVFDQDSGVDIVHAVAASCAVPLVWPAVTIDGKHYIDGGIRSTANVDLAKGADSIVVIAPLPQSFSKATSIRGAAREDRCHPHCRGHPGRPGAGRHRQERARPGQARRCRTQRAATGRRGRREGTAGLGLRLTAGVARSDAWQSDSAARSSTVPTWRR